MTRRVHLQLSAITSDDGTRCAAECPHLSSSWCECTSFRAVVMRHEGGYLRAAACIAAEHAAASVPSCEGARGLDASEALREAHRLGYQAGYRATAADASEHVSRYEREALQHVMRTWEMRYEEVMRERDEARAKLARIRSIAVVRHDLQIDAAMSDVVRIIDEKEGGM